jgi:two-component system cell cycle sensor histidine kinase/response regulator CckA
MDPVTVLLVDDDDQLRGMCRGFLAESGLQVLEAGNGLEALLIAVERKGAIDLVVTDLAMPQIGGAELGRVFKKMWPGVNMLYMSGSPRCAGGEDLPVNEALLPKPFGPHELLGAVDSVLGRGKLNSLMHRAKLLNAVIPKSEGRTVGVTPPGFEALF